ncbi:hypothetical protein [Vibrio natriegens]|nr:hypothetical protein [Vibrio natriegens]
MYKPPDDRMYAHRLIIIEPNNRLGRDMLRYFMDLCSESVLNPDYEQV